MRRAAPRGPTACGGGMRSHRGGAGLLHHAAAAPPPQSDGHPAWSCYTLHVAGRPVNASGDAANCATLAAHIGGEGWRYLYS